MKILNKIKDVQSIEFIWKHVNISATLFPLLIFYSRGKIQYFEETYSYNFSLHANLNKILISTFVRFSLLFDQFYCVFERFYIQHSSLNTQTKHQFLYKVHMQPG